MAKSLNISCVIAAHHEGIMLHWSLLSYEAMRVYAEERGSKVEWVIVLDRADEETVRVVNNFSGIHSDDKIIYETDKTTNELSDAISKDLKKRGMKFVGSTIIYSYLQAVGLIYSHEEHCYLYKNK